MTTAALATLGEVFLRCRDMDAGLAERLEGLFAGRSGRSSRTIATAVDQLVARLFGPTAPEWRHRRPGEPMPPFVLPDENGRLTSLESLLRSGPVAVTFHRGHWCPWCRISGRALARVSSRYRCPREGRSWRSCPSGRSFAAEFKASAQYPFPVLTDVDNGYALSLNLAIWVGPDLERLLSSFGRSLPDYQGNEAWMLPISPRRSSSATDGPRWPPAFIDPRFSVDGCRSRSCSRRSRRRAELGSKADTNETPARRPGVQS